MAKDTPTSAPISTYTKHTKHIRYRFSCSDYNDNFLNVCSLLLIKLCYFISSTEMQHISVEDGEQLPHTNDIGRTVNKILSFPIKDLKSLKEEERIIYKVT